MEGRGFFLNRRDSVWSTKIHYLQGVVCIYWITRGWIYKPKQKEDYGIVRKM